MAHRFEKGKSIYFLFKNGHTVQDSQLKPRYYLDRKKAEEYLPYGDEIVEYVPASLRPKGEWIMKETMVRSPYAKNAYCSECLEETSFAHNFCPNCGADMRGADDGE